MRFADDKGIVTSRQKGLEKAMDALKETAKKYDIKCTWESGKTNGNFQGEGRNGWYPHRWTSIAHVKTFKYLGVFMRENGTRIKEVTSRIGMTKLVFNKTRELVTTSLKKKAEEEDGQKSDLASSTLWLWYLDNEQAGVDKFESFWIVGIGTEGEDDLKGQKTNEDILVLVQSVMKREIWIEHVFRGNSLLNIAIKGWMMSKKPRGRPRMDTIDDLKEGS
jgi:hypothetical protein